MKFFAPGILCALSSTAFAAKGSECAVPTVHFRSADFEERQVPDFAHCRQACEALSECKVFSFNTISRICFLKAAEGIRMRDDDVWSGILDCDRSCFETDVEYVGEQQKEFTLSSPEECEGLCLSMPASCTHWTYFEEKCRLSWTLKEKKNNPLHTSGIPNCVITTTSTDNTSNWTTIDISEPKHSTSHMAMIAIGSAVAGVLLVGGATASIMFHYNCKREAQVKLNALESMATEILEMEPEEM